MVHASNHQSRNVPQSSVEFLNDSYEKFLPQWRGHFKVNDRMGKNFQELVYNRRYSPSQRGQISRMDVSPFSKEKLLKRQRKHHQKYCESKRTQKENLSVCSDFSDFVFFLNYFSLYLLNHEQS